MAKIVEIDGAENKVTERVETKEETAQRAAQLAEVEAIQAKEAEIKALKESAKAKLIAGQPLTADEAATLVI